MAGVAEIPFSEFFFYALAHELDRESVRWLWDDFHTLDKTWVGLTNEEQRKKSEKPKPNKPP